MIRCWITDRAAVGGVDGLIARAATLANRVDWIQVREKDLPARELFQLVSRLSRLGPRIVVNSRADVAVAAGAHGIHLPVGSIPSGRWRRFVPEDFLIGVSCHSLDEVSRAADDGASYVVLSPIFESRSKPGYGPPLGVAALAAASGRVAIPVLALGGVNESNAAACTAAGAAGFAAITAFQGSI